MNNELNRFSLFTVLLLLNKQYSMINANLSENVGNEWTGMLLGGAL